ncbi:efflux RND transporter periplasmic adaptor subunit [Lachnospiraceae bacterium LCP25S3_G4]
MLLKKKDKIEDLEEVQFDEVEQEVTEDGPKKKKKLSGKVLVAIIVVIIGGTILSSVVLGGKSKKTQKQLAVMTVKTGDVKEILNTSGTIESEQKKIIYSPVNAKVEQCNAKVGQVVKKDTKLVLFDTTELERNNQQSQLNELSTKNTNQDAVIQQNRAKAKASEAANQAEQQAVNNYNAMVDQYNQMAAQRATLQQAADAEANENAQKNSNLPNLQKELSDMGIELSKANADLEAVKNDLNNSTDKDELINKVQNLQDAYNQKSNQLKEMTISTTASEALSVADGKLAEMNSQIESLKGSLNVSAESIDGLSGAQLKNMQISENLAELASLTTEELVQKGKDGISADFDGIIADVKVEVGAMAVQGGELFTLVSNKDVGVKLEVSTNDHEKLKVGSKATIKSGGMKYTGEVTSVDKIATTNAKGNPVICAYVHIANPDDQICIGVNAKVSMDVAEVKNVIVIPSEIVNTSTSGDFVYSIKSGKVVKVPVELGVASDTTVEVIKGLKKGDKVVSDVGVDITEGMEAQAVDSKESTNNDK